MSREKLAARVGTSSSTIARIELSGHVPSVATLSRIAHELELDPGRMMTAAVESVA